MKPLTFDELARMPVVEHYETAFRKATGVTLKVVAPDGCTQGKAFGSAGNSFCAGTTATSAGCAACFEAEARLMQRAARNLLPQQIHCYAGLTVVAVPVVVGGQHVATLLSGQVFRREPTERDFLLVIKMLGGGQSADWVRKARKAYFDTPVVTADAFQAITQLLNVFAQYLAEFAGRTAIASSVEEPGAVASAKEFVQSHAEEPITLDQVVKHVHVSRFYFCKLFKKVTGMTLTEYVSRVRVEKAKELLVDPSMRVSEIVYATGFGSIPRFNAVFKQLVGMPATEYRSALKSRLAV
jgi:AraC-like DNA-binding protein/ligand-binding sensor protein